MQNLPNDFRADVGAIGQISAIPSILEVICRSTGMGFAAVARVTESRWIACAVKDDINFGLHPGEELKIETTICNEIRNTHEPVVIDNVSEDQNFCNHHTPLMYGFQSYISYPIFLKDGGFFGTLCAIDPKPARLNTPEVKEMFRLFADLIAFHLAAVYKLAASEADLKEERRIAELRDQFIAILGHDLRNPVGAVASSASLLQLMSLPDEAGRLVQIIKNSSYRMIGLINNVMDFASGTLGDGITLNRSDNEPMAELLRQVINELQIIYPDCIIDTKINIASPVNCDGKRVAQLFSNLLGNALKYGKKGEPVLVEAYTNGGEFVLSVANAGNEIPAAVKDKLFHPFVRGEVTPQQQGLGLGLYIASEIARAHGGTLIASSSSSETKFVFRLSLN